MRQWSARLTAVGLAVPLALAVAPTPRAGAHGGVAGTGASLAEPTTYVVASGDTLSEIAAGAGVVVGDLAAANGIVDPDRIRAGQELVIPSGWRCPVPGVTRFVNDFGVRKLDGRVHEGVDLHAPRRSVVVAPVSGEVRYVVGRRGGLQFDLAGDDGARYVGSHLEAPGFSGRVRPGDPLGMVGDSGNARGASPHLHFEFLPDHVAVANPFELLSASCP